MKNKKLRLSLIIFTLLVIASFGVLLTRARLFTTPSPTVTSNTNIQKFAVDQKIIFSDEKQSDNENVEVISGQNVLDILAKTKRIETKEYSFGKLVETIEGVKNGTDNKYWIFYINGEESKVGAGDYKLQPNDKVEWKFETYEQ